MIWRVVALGVVENYVTGWVLHYVYLPDQHVAAGAVGLHEGHGAREHHELSPLLHFLRDSTLALPVTIAVLLIAALAVRAFWRADTARARIAYAVAAALVAGVASVPEVLAHGWLFDEQVAGVSLASHLTGVALVTIRYTFALTLIAAVLFGVPWRASRASPSSSGATGSGCSTARPLTASMSSPWARATLSTSSAPTADCSRPRSPSASCRWPPPSGPR
ncbi:hypothetical protein [Kribbella sp. NPDC051718]|uniref:hypothetical protein n=1 Tax=Kribbella sp. NPDC051718 TaxID=3155168 RepID=UPI0034390626